MTTSELSPLSALPRDHTHAPSRPTRQRVQDLLGLALLGVLAGVAGFLVSVFGPGYAAAIAFPALLLGAGLVTAVVIRRLGARSRR